MFDAWPISGNQMRGEEMRRQGDGHMCFLTFETKIQCAVKGAFLQPMFSQNQITKLHFYR